MIIDSCLRETEHKRRQLPAQLVEHFVDSCRKGITEVTIAVLDQLAPQMELKRRAVHSESAVRTLFMPTIADAIRSICYIAPPASVTSPILTMAPDPADHASFPPQMIRDQWRSVVDTSCDGSPWHSWRDVAFGSISRVDGYQLAAHSPFVIRTRSVEPYANIWITINPSTSQVLRRLPAAAPAQLIGYLSQAGHGNGVAIVPESFSHLFTCGAHTIHAEGSVEQVASAVATLWQPDTYVKHPKDTLQRGFGIHHPTLGASTFPALPNGWSDPAVQQVLSEEQMQEALHSDLVGVVVVAAGGGNSVLLMTNGISGHDGGF